MFLRIAPRLFGIFVVPYYLLYMWTGCAFSLAWGVRARCRGSGLNVLVFCHCFGITGLLGILSIAIPFLVPYILPLNLLPGLLRIVGGFKIALGLLGL